MTEEKARRKKIHYFPVQSVGRLIREIRGDAHQNRPCVVWWASRGHVMSLSKMKQNKEMEFNRKESDRGR